MNEKSQATVPALDHVGLDDVLSHDAETRCIELALLERLARAVTPVAAEPPAIEDAVSAQLSQMRSPLFGALPACLARGIPAQERFGPFRGRK